jgi:hypothetical protein
MISSPMRMYAPILDLDFMMLPPLNKFYARHFRSPNLIKIDKNRTRIFGFE